jgi:hypothetical protein
MPAFSNIELHLGMHVSEKEEREEKRKENKRKEKMRLVGSFAECRPFRNPTFNRSEMLQQTWYAPKDLECSF